MNNKNKIKAGLIFGILMATFYILQDLLTSNNLTTKNVLIVISSGLIGGALSGLVFGWLMGKFVNSKLVTKGTEIDLETGENIVFETGANHFKGVEAVGGKLYLTNKRLVFKSHKFNIQDHELSIPLSDISKVERTKTWGIINNSLSITTTGNKIEKFVVEHPDEWINYLGEKYGIHQMHLQ
ncbi:MAG: GRAM domain-containing protein [Saprospiraceae bacterium]